MNPFMRALANQILEKRVQEMKDSGMPVENIRSFMPAMKRDVLRDLGGPSEEIKNPDVLRLNEVQGDRAMQRSLHENSGLGSRILNHITGNTGDEYNSEEAVLKEKLVPSVYESDREDPITKNPLNLLNPFATNRFLRARNPVMYDEALRLGSNIAAVGAAGAAGPALAGALGAGEAGGAIGAIDMALTDAAAGGAAATGVNAAAESVRTNSLKPILNAPVDYLESLPDTLAAGAAMGGVAGGLNAVGRRISPYTREYARATGNGRYGNPEQPIANPGVGGRAGVMKSADAANKQILGAMERGTAESMRPYDELTQKYDPVPINGDAAAEHFLDIARKPSVRASAGDIMPTSGSDAISETAEKYARFVRGREGGMPDNAEGPALQRTFGDVRNLRMANRAEGYGPRGPIESPTGLAAREFNPGFNKILHDEERFPGMAAADNLVENNNARLEAVNDFLKTKNMGVRVPADAAEKELGLPKGALGGKPMMFQSGADREAAISRLARIMDDTEPAVKINWERLKNLYPEAADAIDQLKAAKAYQATRFTLGGNSAVQKGLTNLANRAPLWPAIKQNVDAIGSTAWDYTNPTGPMNMQRNLPGVAAWIDRQNAARESENDRNTENAKKLKR